MSSRNVPFIVVRGDILYQIGIRCLAATALSATYVDIGLYQIGIRCLAATILCKYISQYILYQIGIRCLAATRLLG